MSNVLCDTCGNQIDAGNTGTICTPCVSRALGGPLGPGSAIQVLQQIAGTSAQRKTFLQSAQPARPLLIGSPTPVSTPTGKTITVEYLMPIRVTVELGSGNIEDVTAKYNDAYQGEPTAFYNAQGEKVVPAIVPPKFNSPDEADAWLEANPVQTGIVADPADLEQAQAVASKADLADWF